MAKPFPCLPMVLPVPKKQQASVISIRPCLTLCRGGVALWCSGGFYHRALRSNAFCGVVCSLVKTEMRSVALCAVLGDNLAQIINDCTCLIWKKQEKPKTLSVSRRVLLFLFWVQSLRFLGDNSVEVWYHPRLCGCESISPRVCWYCSISQAYLRQYVK